MDEIEKLQAILSKGQDNALLRFSLGNAYLKEKKYRESIDNLAIALKYDPEYSAAWKLYAKALAENGDTQCAIDAFRKGIQVAEKKGDIQAAREMNVFMKRLTRK